MAGRENFRFKNNFGGVYPKNEPGSWFLTATYVGLLIIRVICLVILSLWHRIRDHFW